MIFERVNFNEEVIRGMSREDFESKHIDHLWLDRDKATRKKMLSQVYGMITKPPRQSKKKSE